MNEDVEKQIREAWSRKSFPVDPEHRADMEALLNRKDRRRPVIFWWLGGSAMLVLAIVLYLAAPAKELQQDAAGSDSPAVPAAESPASQAPDGDPNQSGKDRQPAEEMRKQVKPDIRKASTPDQPRTENKSLEAAPTAKDRVISEALDVQASPSAQRASSPADPAADPFVGQLSGEDLVPGQSAESNSPSLAAANPVDATHRQLLDIPFLPTGDINPLYANSTGIGVPWQKTTAARWYLFAEASGSHIPSNTPGYLSGWQAALGGGVGFGLAPRLEGLVSAGYMLQDGGFSFQRSSTVKQLGYGARSSFHTLSPDRLHHVYAKAGLQYRLRRHMFTVRGGAMYLYGAQGDITIQQTDQLSTPAPAETAYTWLNVNGLRRWFGTADLTYGYQLTRALSLSAGAMWRPSSISQDDQALSDEGYLWNGTTASWQPVLSLQYRFYGKR